MELVTRFLQAPIKSFVLFGPRGTGKSTWIQRVLLEDYPEATRLFLYRGKDHLKKGRILCLPCEEFLRGLKPGAKLVD